MFQRCVLERCVVCVALLFCDTAVGHVWVLETGQPLLAERGVVGRSGDSVAFHRTCGVVDWPMVGVQDITCSKSKSLRDFLCDHIRSLSPSVAR